jgi:TPP-dependent indolepyruvate ferredoxin oxidoreductase alpha subunit
VRDRAQAFVEKYKLSGAGPAARDALHFKLMALDRDFKRVHANALACVRCSVCLQVSLNCLKSHAVVAGDAAAMEALPTEPLSLVYEIRALREES